MHITRAEIRADILGLGFPLYFFVSESLCNPSYVVKELWGKVCTVGHSANLWHNTFRLLFCGCEGTNSF